MRLWMIGRKSVAEILENIQMSRCFECCTRHMKNLLSTSRIGRFRLVGKRSCRFRAELSDLLFMRLFMSCVHSCMLVLLAL